jgi:thiosulfate/3-mercaptopyruvate sulfurtransferase
MPTSPLISGDALADDLDDARLRILDATVVLQAPGPDMPVAARSGRPGFDAAHLPGAAFADLLHDLADPDAPQPFGLPGTERFAERIGRLGIGPDSRVVVYDQGSTMWATRLWWLLRYFGLDDVQVLDGGLPAWCAADLPISTDAATYPAAAFVGRARHELLADRDDIGAAITTDGEALVNMLPSQAFRGDVAPAFCARPGRIPGSTNVPYNELLDPQTGRFRAVEELDRLLAPDAGRPTILYCGSGISATIGALARELVGRPPARLYDGSLAEWTADPQRPVEVG